ncbi:MAG TPA: hypothetical protein VGL71_06060 [Urbifossiella sp.]
MNDDPFITLIIEALNLMHPRFAAANLRYEFYHQLRRLWDKALPVQLGLGHIMIQADPDAPSGPQPDFLIWQLGERGQPDRRLGAVSVIQNHEAIATLMRFKELGYPYAVAIGIDRTSMAFAGVTRIVYDSQQRTAFYQTDA